MSHLPHPDVTRSSSDSMVGTADYVHRQVTSIDAALRFSRQLDESHRRIDELVTYSCAAYEDFRTFEAKMRLDWAETPESYDQQIHEILERAANIWFANLRLIVRLVQGHHAFCETEFAHFPTALGYLRALLAIEQMDTDLDPSLFEDAEEALAQHRAGETVAD